MHKSFSKCCRCNFCIIKGQFYFSSQSCSLGNYCFSSPALLEYEIAAEENPDLLPSLVGTLQKHAFWKHKLQSSAGLILPDCMPRIRSKFNMRNRKWQALSLPNCCLKSHDWLRCVKFWQSSPAAWPPREIQITQQQPHIPTNRRKMFGAQKNELENKHK